MMQVVQGSERSIGDKVRVTDFVQKKYIGKEGYIGYDPTGKLCVIIDGATIKGENFYKCIDLKECSTEITQQGPFHYDSAAPVSYTLTDTESDSSKKMSKKIELTKFVLNSSSDEKNSNEYKVELLKEFLGK